MGESVDIPNGIFPVYMKGWILGGGDEGALVTAAGKQF